MEYCSKCVYPMETAVGMHFDDQAVCSGCRYFEELDKTDWVEKRKELDDLLAPYKNSNRPYDCIIPVSGGKDSHYQTHLIREVFGLKPLLVTFNHVCSPYIGLKNLSNIITKFRVDHIRFTPNPALVKQLMKYTLKKLGDTAWFCQTGVVTVPIQVAVQYKIPLIVWGEHGWSHLFGKNSVKDKVTFSKEEREKLFMRGLGIDQVLEDNPNIARRDLSWIEYPDQEKLDALDIKGVYLGNYIKWNQKELTEYVIEKYGFTTRPKARTYNTYADVDCHICSGTNDYLKYLKFGYGRTTDHASQDIREGRLTREEGIKLVKHFDGVRPEDLDEFLRQMEITEDELMEIMEPFRKPNAWEKKADGSWNLKASIDPENKISTDGVDEIIDRLAFVKNWKEEELRPEWCL